MSEAAPVAPAPVAESTPAPEAEKPAEKKAEAENPAEAKPEPRKLKLKVDDREEELDEDTVVRLAQKGKAADKRFAEAADLAKKAKTIIESARTPERRMEALVALFGSEDEVREFAEGLVLEQIQRQGMTPEQAEAAKERAELERYRKAEKEREENEKKTAAEKAQAEVYARAEKTVLGIAEAAGLPNEPWAFELVAGVLEPIVENEIPLTKEQILAEVKEAYEARTKSYGERVIGSLEGKALLDRLGPDVVKRVLQASVSTYKPAPKPVEAPPAPKDEPAFLSPREFRRRRLSQ